MNKARHRQAVVELHRKRKRVAERQGMGTKRTRLARRVAEKAGCQAWQVADLEVCLECPVDPDKGKCHLARPAVPFPHRGT